MADTKKMDEAKFSKVVKELTAFGELIRTRQDEKQSVLNEFEKEKKRFKSGKISKKAFASSVKKVNKELSKLDVAIKHNILQERRITNKIKVIAINQAPKKFRVTMTGIKLLSKKKKKK